MRCRVAGVDEADLRQSLRDYYRDEPFVVVRRPAARHRPWRVRLLPRTAPPRPRAGHCRQRHRQSDQGCVQRGGPSCNLVSTSPKRWTLFELPPMTRSPYPADFASALALRIKSNPEARTSPSSLPTGPAPAPGSTRRLSCALPRYGSTSRERHRQFAVIANSGNANTCTGATGLFDAQAMLDRTALAIGVDAWKYWSSRPG